VETARETSSIETTTPQHSKKAVSNAPSFLAVLIALSIRATRELYRDKSDEELSPVVEATSIVKLTFAMKKGELAAKLVPSVFFVLTQLRSNEEKKTVKLLRIDSQAVIEQFSFTSIGSSVISSYAVSMETAVTAIDGEVEGAKEKKGDGKCVGSAEGTRVGEAEGTGV